MAVVRLSFGALPPAGACPVPLIQGNGRSAFCPMNHAWLVESTPRHPPRLRCLSWCCRSQGAGGGGTKPGDLHEPGGPGLHVGRPDRGASFASPFASCCEDACHMSRRFGVLLGRLVCLLLASDKGDSIFLNSTGLGYRPHIQDR